MGAMLLSRWIFRRLFDTMDWNFLLLVLHSFGFHTVFCDWIRAILHSARLSILVNGSIVGFFPLEAWCPSR